MELKTKTRYAILAILDIALQQSQRPVTLLDIARRQGISQSYLEQIFVKLREKDLVKSVRGPGGGYKINASLDSVTVDQIVRAMSDHVEEIDKMIDFQPAQIKMQSLWNELNHVMHEFCEKVTLAQLAEANV